MSSGAVFSGNSNYREIRSANFGATHANQSLVDLHVCQFDGITRYIQVNYNVSPLHNIGTSKPGTKSFWFGKVHNLVLLD